jgi:hypothetical protein
MKKIAGLSAVAFLLGGLAIEAHAQQNMGTRGSAWAWVVLPPTTTSLVRQFRVLRNPGNHLRLHSLNTNGRCSKASSPADG